MAHGNHDPLDRWSASLAWPDNVHIFQGKGVERVVYEKNKPETLAMIERQIPDVKKLELKISYE